jgi:alkylhydroperoxidase/carboxymuconolactone decarboxylase family protein YurZ
MAELDDAQRRLRDEFIRLRGYWAPFWDDMLRLDAEFFSAYLSFSGAPWRNGGLPPKIKEMIYIAVDAATTHLYEPGLRIHVRNALKHGALREEIVEVLQLAAAIGVHACTFGVPILLDELRQAGVADPAEAAPLNIRQEALKRAFIDLRGYWSPVWDDILRLAPDFFAAYMQFSSVPWRAGPLEPKVKELIYIAVDAATTHLYEPGLRIHIRNALQRGASQAEILETLELVSAIGVHSCTMGIPALLDELRRLPAEPALPGPPAAEVAPPCPEAVSPLDLAEPPELVVPIAAPPPAEAAPPPPEPAAAEPLEPAPPPAEPALPVSTEPVPLAQPPEAAPAEPALSDEPK